MRAWANSSTCGPSPVAPARRQVAGRTAPGDPATALHQGRRRRATSPTLNTRLVRRARNTCARPGPKRDSSASGSASQGRADASSRAVASCADTAGTGPARPAASRRASTPTPPAGSGAERQALPVQRAGRLDQAGVDGQVRGDLPGGRAAPRRAPTGQRARARRWPRPGLPGSGAQRGGSDPPSRKALATGGVGVGQARGTGPGRRAPAARCAPRRRRPGRPARARAPMPAARTRPQTDQPGR
jgi:hypothetical protein